MEVPEHLATVGVRYEDGEDNRNVGTRGLASSVGIDQRHHDNHPTRGYDFRDSSYHWRVVNAPWFVGFGRA